MPLKSKTKVLIFCPPFDGHLNVIKELFSRSGDLLDCRIVITGWKNIPVNKRGLDKSAVSLARSELSETDPASWTFPRVAELLGDCHDIAKSYKPDLILYDFFSIEGYLVGELLGIPAWSSIPAFLGSFTEKEYLAGKLGSQTNKSSINLIRKRYGVEIDAGDLEMISDGIFLPGEVNIVWSYPSLVSTDFKTNRHDKHYIFVGSARTAASNTKIATRKSRPIIYLSFGTVVMNNFWNQRIEIRKGLTEFFGELARIWKAKPWDVVLATQGKHILDRYPDNWVVEHSVDQFEVLRQADVFVTHGGSNSFHEAVLVQTPMVVVPFFGDQPLVARTVATMGIGRNLVFDASIDTHDAKHYIDKDLARSVDNAVQDLLEDSSYKAEISAISLAHTDVYSLLSGKIKFAEGDLLYGTNIARQRYVADHELQEEFTILEFKSFSELAPYRYSMPRIIDIYHDVILNDEYFEKDSQSHNSTYIKHLSEYKQYLKGETDFEKMCLKGLDFFTQYYQVHFLLNDFDPSVNRITKAEINYVLGNQQRFQGKVIFYWRLHDFWVPVPYSMVSDLTTV